MEAKYKPFSGVKQLESRKLPGSYSDLQCKGLYLKIGANGSRSWVYRYQLNGIRREMGMGPYPAIGLEMAHAAVAAAAVLVGRKIDPLDERNALKAQETAVKVKEKLAGITLRHAIADYVAIKGAAWRSDKYRTQWAKTVEYNLRDYLDTSISSITLDQVEGVLRAIWLTKTETAVRILGRICNIIDYSKIKGWRDIDATGWANHLKTVLPTIPPKAKRIHNHPALPYKQAPKWWSAERNGNGVAALELLVLTATRSGEVRGAVAGEFDLNAGLWVIPAGRMKAGVEHRVTLSCQAIELVRPLLEGLEPNDLVFKSIHNTPMHDGTVFRAIGEGWMDERGQAISVHGFRSTFRDWVAEATDFDGIAAERCLAHSVGNAVEKAYRRGDQLEKRRVIMQAWADFLVQDTQ